MAFRRLAFPACLLLLIPTAVVQGAPLVFSGKFDAPDFNQLNSAYPNGGNYYCVPTSDADGVVWLHNHGFTRLPGAGQEETIVTDLAALMHTNPNSGTSTANNLQGMRDYLGSFYGPSNVLVSSLSLFNLDRSTLEENWQQVAEYVTRSNTIVTLWGGGLYQGMTVGLHSVFLAGYDMANYASTDRLEISFHDPITGPTEWADTYTMDLWPIGNKYCYRTTEYPDLPSTPIDEVILTGAFVFQIVPEPSAMAMWIPGSLALLITVGIRRRAGARLRNQP